MLRRKRRLCLLPTDFRLGTLASVPKWIHRLSYRQATDDVTMFRKLYFAKKDEVAYHFILLDLYSKLNALCFGQLLPQSCEIFWTTKLQKSSGFTKLHNDGRIDIGISESVVKTFGQLVSTLLHEMCHVGQFAISRVTSPPHGKAFLYWMDIVNKKLPFLQVTIRHEFC